MSSARVRVELSNRAENVPMVRQVLGGFAAAAGIPQADLHDMSLALSEACNNASLHAYGGAEGPLEVELHTSPAAVFARVRDWGVGLTLPIDSTPEFPADVEGGLAGLGLPMILGLADSVRLSTPDGGGTAVEMVFPRGARDCGQLASPPGHTEPLGIVPGQLASTVALEMTPPGVAKEVLPRVLRGVASRAHFSVTRVEEVLRIAALPLTDAPHWAESGRVQARVVDDTGVLELSIGPMSAEDVLELETAARRLAPGFIGTVRSAPATDQLVLRLSRSA
jgi:serine/threonine-protein kinase RsbW